jgi:hypothetical protein
MLGFLKMSVMSAVLSVGVVNAYNHAGASGGEPVSGKLYYDRIASGDGSSFGATSKLVAAGLSEIAAQGAGKGNRLSTTASKACSQQTWPHIAPDCVTRGDGLPRRGSIRVVTIETREGNNTSVLRRVPETGVASR